MHYDRSPSVGPRIVDTSHFESASFHTGTLLPPVVEVWMGGLESNPLRLSTQKKIMGQEI